MSRTTPKADLLNDIENYTCGEVPSPLEVLVAPMIDNWTSKVRRRGQEFICVVKGDVKRHPDFADGAPITTGAVLWFDRKGRFVRTGARVFNLGEQAGQEIPIEGIDV